MTAIAEFIEELAARPAVRAALASVRARDDETLADMRAAVVIPAPTRDEAARAAWLRSRLQAAGCRDIACDAAGNVIARIAGAQADAAPVAVVAHLDSIFPHDTPLTLAERAGTICAPGIADNVRGLAVLLALARALHDAGTQPNCPLLLIGSVGEEGAGDLYGMKALCGEDGALRNAAAVIAIDGSGARRIVTQAIGSRRLRCTITGPGGHSWSDFGTPNPLHASSAAIARCALLELPREPRATLTIARAAAGTSINAIPEEAWAEIDIRCEEAEPLHALEAEVRSIFEEESNARRRRRGTRGLELKIEVIGDRPAGSTPADTPVVRIARAVTRFIGERPELVASSTDANVPISLGIPAIAIGGGGESGNMHTVREWYRNTGGVEGITRVLLIALALAERSAD